MPGKELLLDGWKFKLFVGFIRLSSKEVVYIKNPKLRDRHVLR
jgi:hypothetical protein